MQGANDADQPPDRGAGRGMDPLKRVRRLVVLVVGSTVLVLGGAMLLLPGPGLLGLLLGLSILASEFAWARRLLKRARSYASLATSGGKGSDAAGASTARRGPESGR